MYLVHSAPQSAEWKSNPVKQILVEELQAAGYEVDAHDNFYDLEAAGHNPANMEKATLIGNMEAFKKNYDAVFYFVYMKGYAQENVVRLSYSTGHASEIPWFVPEVPTVAISLNYTTHLNDLHMMRAFVNAYAPTRMVIRETIRKIAGESTFNGICNDIPFCGRWDTRI
jgi:beta-N-acetylhexosaminidase